MRRQCPQPHNRLDPPCHLWSNFLCQKWGGLVQEALHSNLGQNLADIRQMLGVSQAAVAGLAGVSIPSLRMVERGRGRISTYLAVTLALDCSLHWRGFKSSVSLGVNLKMRRRQLGLSQRAVASLLGISRQTLVSMEIRDRGRVETLDALLRLLRIQPKLGTNNQEAPGTNKRRLIPGANDGAADKVYTPRDLARLIIGHFPLQGTVLDPCRGTGAFFDQLPVDQVQREWCEIEDGRDFFDWHRPVDWVLTNPPWSKFRAFLKHSMTVAENVVFLATLNHFTTRARLSDIGAAKFGIREILLFPTPQKDWPQSGFQVAVVHLQRGWAGACRIDDRHLAGRTYPVVTQ